MKVLAAVLLLCLLAPINVHSKYVITPGGFMVWDTCFHEIASGTHIEDRESEGVYVTQPGGHRTRLPKCPYPNIHVSSFRYSPAGASVNLQGWQTWTSFQSPGNISFDSFNGYFTVPDNPTAWDENPDGAVAYVFTGLQNINWIPDGVKNVTSGFKIIQPVLQYGGGSENGGGKYWGIASWYVTVDAGALWSKTLKVNPGDKLYGIMQEIATDQWLIASQIPAGTWTNITVNKPRLSSNPWAYLTLETYNIKSCDWLPISQSVTLFSNLVLTSSGNPVTPTWNIFTEAADQCKSNFTSATGTSATLQYQGAF